MDKRVINSALDFLGNGGTLPDNPDVRRRFEFTAAMMKALFDSQADQAERTIRAIETVSTKQADMTVGLEQVLRETATLRQSPSLIYLFRYHTMPFLAALSGAFLAGLTGWFVLYTLAEAFKLAAWINEVLHIPPLNG